MRGAIPTAIFFFILMTLIQKFIIKPLKSKREEKEKQNKL